MTLSLSLFKILHWRKSIPASFRTPLVDAVWKDGKLTWYSMVNLLNVKGLLYFSWMMSEYHDSNLLASYPGPALSCINIGLVIQTGVSVAAMHQGVR